MPKQFPSGFFGVIPTSVAAAIESLGREVHALPSARLFAEGDQFADFQILLAGHVQLEMNVPGRGRMPILTLGPGDVLGWSAALSDGTMTATATALDSVCTLNVPGEKLRQLCEAQPEVGYHFMKQLAVALSRRLLATRLQLLDLFADHEPLVEARAAISSFVDPEC